MKMKFWKGKMSGVLEMEKEVIGAIVERISNKLKRELALQKQLRSIDTWILPNEKRPRRVFEKLIYRKLFRDSEEPSCDESCNIGYDKTNHIVHDLSRYD